jgi:hypothetical protein
MGSIVDSKSDLACSLEYSGTWQGEAIVHLLFLPKVPNRGICLTGEAIKDSNDLLVQYM